VKLPIVWMPEASAELRQARDWYDNVRPAMGSDSHWRWMRHWKPLRNVRCSFPTFIAGGGVLACDGFLTGYSSKCRQNGLW